MTESDVPTPDSEAPKEADPDDAQAEAAFTSAFNGPTDPPTEAAPSPGEPVALIDPEDAVVEPTPAEPTPAPRPTLDDAAIQRLLDSAAKVEQFQTELERSTGAFNGKLGGLERTLQEMQAKTPAGHALQLSIEDFEELKADFPELAEMQVKGLNRALAKLKGTAPAFDPAQVEQLVSARVEAVQQQAALDLADATMPGWRQTVQGPDYNAWLARQPADYQTQMRASWKWPEIQASISAFKAAKAPAPKASAPNTRRERMAATVTPRGVGGPVAPDTDVEHAFQAGFNGR